MKFEGIYTPAITPLGPDGEIDCKAFAAVLESLVAVGTLVRVDDEFLVVDIRRSVRSDVQGAEIDALERHGMLVRDPDDGSVRVRRSEIAHSTPYPPQPVATAR